jgi:hypothetical protein
MAIFGIVDFDPFSIGSIEGGSGDEADVSIFGRADENNEEL